MKSGLSDWFAVFRAGRHTSSGGQTRTFTRSDLEGIVERYTGDQPSPCVITHEELYSPFAYAQIQDLRVGEGDVLEARCAAETIEPKFESMVRDGRLYNRSVQLLPQGDGWRLGHVAFLGAQPPAVEGLEPIRFAAAGLVFAAEEPWDRVEEATRWSDLIGVVGRLVRRLLSPEDAEEVMPDWMSEAAQREVGRAQERASQEIQQKEKNEMSETYSQADLETARQKAAQEGAAKAKQEFAAREAALEKERRELAREGLKGRVDRLIEGGRVTPAQAEGLVEFALSLEGSEALEFSRGKDDQAEKVEVNPSEWLFAFLKQLPVQVEIGQESGGEGPKRPDLTDPGQIRRAALEYQAEEKDKGRVVSDAEAVRHVTGGNKA